MDDWGSIPDRDKEQSFSLASEAHPASCQIGTERVLSPGVKRGPGVTPTSPPLVVPRSRMSRSYNSSLLWRLHGSSGTFYFVYFTSYCVECRLTGI
jgi:hypothetical protein